MTWVAINWLEDWFEVVATFLCLIPAQVVAESWKGLWTEFVTWGMCRSLCSAQAGHRVLNSLLCSSHAWNLDFSGIRVNTFHLMFRPVLLVLSVICQLKHHEHMRENTELSCSYHSSTHFFVVLPISVHATPIHSMVQSKSSNSPLTPFILLSHPLSVSSSFSSVFKI